MRREIIGPEVSVDNLSISFKVLLTNCDNLWHGYANKTKNNKTLYPEDFTMVIRVDIILPILKN